MVLKCDYLTGSCPPLPGRQLKILLMERVVPFTIPYFCIASSA